MLQELYISPAFLTSSEWDELSASIKFARAYQQTLIDTHWVGGNPDNDEVYGWAAWRRSSVEVAGTSGNNHSCTLTLRNPSLHSRSLQLEPTAIFELPHFVSESVATFDLQSVYAEQRVRKVTLRVGQQTTLTFAPYEVLSFQGSVHEATG